MFILSIKIQIMSEIFEFSRQNISKFKLLFTKQKFNLSAKIQHLILFTNLVEKWFLKYQFLARKFKYSSLKNHFNFRAKKYVKKVSKKCYFEFLRQNFSNVVKSNFFGGPKIWAKNLLLKRRWCMSSKWEMDSVLLCFDDVPSRAKKNWSKPFFFYSFATYWNLGYEKPDLKMLFKCKTVTLWLLSLDSIISPKVVKIS